MTRNSYASLILDAGALSIRNIAKGEEPFLYSSGMKGPGYAMVKGLVTKSLILKGLISALADKVAAAVPHLNFVAGNATGGMIPGWLLAEALEVKLGRRVPFVYIRGSRKKGGHKEHITGIIDSEQFAPGDIAIVFEELVNFAQTTCNSAVLLREAGYDVTHAACILSYDHDQCRSALKEHEVELVHLVTMAELLAEAEAAETFSPDALADYRKFLENPAAWMAANGLTRDEGGGTQ